MPYRDSRRTLPLADEPYSDSLRRRKARVLLVIATLFGAAATAFVADWPKLAPDEDLIIEREGAPNLTARHDELYAFPEREREGQIKNL